MFNGDFAREKEGAEGTREREREDSNLKKIRKLRRWKYNPATKNEGEAEGACEERSEGQRGVKVRP